MRPLRIRSVFGVCALLGCAFTSRLSAQQPSDTKPSPLTSKLPVIKSKAVAEFCKRHRQAKSLSFSAYLSTNAEDDQFGMATQTWYLVNAKRPNRFMIQGGPDFHYEPRENGVRHDTFRSAGNNIGVSDGKNQLQVNSFLHVYKIALAPASLAQATADAFKAIGGSDVLSASLLAGYESAPDEDLNILTHALVFVRHEPQTDLRLANYSVWHKLYFSADTGELLRYSHFVRTRDTGHETEDQQVDYDNWKFNPKLAASTFDTTPPRNARTMEEMDKAIKAALAAAKH